MNDETLFHLALEKPAGERSAFLDRECAGDANLRRRVEILLRSHETPDSFLAGPAADPGVMEEFGQGLTAEAGPGRPDGKVSIRKSPAEGPGDQIGPYKLLQQLGEGGMGTVYMAEQVEPVRRRVALKVIKPGMDSRQVVARFEAERQALAMMDHVNIARVLDAGATEAGRPYFVMELVHGVPITKYCDDNQLSPRQRLELFVPVCQAIQHAHQKGIIHRDIKPSNVMITLYDGKPVPKVIDFGVAKATEQNLTERTLFTQYGTLVGTLEYMSPEQAEMSALGIDTRSDIFSLGVLLYELLTGNTPLTHKRMKEGAYAEILRMIKEDEPPKPSTRLSVSGEALASISARRHMEPAKLTKLVRGELDWIVMKTLEKDRNRRYETAKDFAADVQRYLDDEPVQACPPSRSYRFRKFARRNKRALATLSVLALAVLVVAGTLGWALRDREAREVERVRERATLQAATAAKAEQALAESDALYRQRKLPDAIQIARNALSLVHGGEGGPAVKSRAQEWLKDLDMVGRLEELHPRADGSWSKKLLEYPRAFREYGIDIEALPPEAAAARIAARPIRVDLAVALDRWVEYVSNWGPSMNLGGDKGVALRARLGKIARLADPDPLRNRVRDAYADGGVGKPREIMQELAASADLAATPIATLMLIADAQEWRESIAFYTRVQRQHPGDFGITFGVGRMLRIGGNPDGAIRFLTAAVSIRPQSRFARTELGRALVNKGLLDEGIAAFRELARLAPNSSSAQLSIGSALLRKPGFEKEAAAAFRESVRLAPDAAQAHDQVGWHYFSAGRYDDALAAYREAIRLKPDYYQAHYYFGVSLEKKGLLDDAIAAYREAIRLKPDLVLTSDQLGNQLGTVLEKTGFRDEAIAAHREAVRLDPKIAHVWSSWAWLLATHPDPKRRDPAQALQLAKKAVALKSTEGSYWQSLAWAEYRAGDWKTAVAAMEKVKELGSAGNSREWFLLAMAHWKLGNKVEARKWYGQAIAWMDKNQPANKELGRFRAEAAELLGVNDKKD
jgi:eukaryotic-like serine/threonine-protein kinase